MSASSISKVSEDSLVKLFSNKFNSSTSAQKSLVFIKVSFIVFSKTFKNKKSLSIPSFFKKKKFLSIFFFLY